jgi:hypothetical protein
MNTTGIFTIHRHEISGVKLNEPIYLIPFGDIHRHSPLCHEEKWMEFLGWAKTKKNAYFLGMGDYDDLASASERDILSNRHLHEATKDTLENVSKKFTDKLSKELSFMNGRLIGLLEGNHYSEYSNGTTSSQRMCETLNCKYLGCNAFIRLILKSNTKHATTLAVDIFAHHGMGAARFSGGSIKRVEDMQNVAQADIYLMGHDHRKSVATKSLLRLSQAKTNVRLSHQKIIIGRTGSFLRGYVDGVPSYVADRNLVPSDLGVIKIELTWKLQNNSQDYHEWVDLHASV